MVRHVLIEPTRQDGDRRHEFDPADAAEVSAAEARFNEIVGIKKHAAFAMPNDGSPGRQIKSFDPTIERVMFRAPLQGG